MQNHHLNTVPTLLARQVLLLLELEISEERKRLVQSAAPSRSFRTTSPGNNDQRYTDDLLLLLSLSFTLFLVLLFMNSFVSYAPQDRSLRVCV